MMVKGTEIIGTQDHRREVNIIRRIEEVGAAIDREKMRSETAEQKILDRLTHQLTALQKTYQSQTVSNEIERLYTEYGAVGLNASTGQDLITYHVSIPANRIELWARLESDRMMHPVFLEYYAERNVAMEARRQRSESDPDGKLFERYLSTAFIAHPYRRPILGWPSDMSFLDLAYMRGFFRRTHAANNTAVTVVGDVKFVDIVKIVEKYFSHIPSQKLSSIPITKEPVQSGERRVEVILAAEPKMITGYHKPPPQEGRIFSLPKDVPQSVIIFGWIAPSKKNPRFFPFEIIDFIIGSGGFLSKMFQEIRTDRGLAYSTGSFYTAKSEYGLFGAYALTKSESTIEVISLIRSIICDINEKSVPPDELKKAKKSILNNFIFSFTSIMIELHIFFQRWNFY
jgi:predicted Zn-dependent peptidase